MCTDVLSFAWSSAAGSLCERLLMGGHFQAGAVLPPREHLAKSGNTSAIAIGEVGATASSE